MFLFFDNLEKRQADIHLKLLRAHGECLGSWRLRRAQSAAIIAGELQTSFDPAVPEWENPYGVMSVHPVMNP